MGSLEENVHLKCGRQTREAANLFMLLGSLSSSLVKAKKALACRGLCVRRGSDPLFIRRSTAKVDTPPRHEDIGMHPDPPPSFLFPYRGEAAEAPLWKATKTPGITSLCFSSAVFTFSPFALFFSPSLSPLCSGLCAAVEYTMRSSRSLPEGRGGAGLGP